MGFSINGLIFVVIILAPSLLIIIFPPYNAPVKTEKSKLIYTVLERIGQISYLTILIFSKTGFQYLSLNLWLFLSIICIICYYGLWIRYLVMGRDFSLLFSSVIIPIPMAVLPVLIFGFLTIWCKSLWLGLSGLLFAVGHLSISWRTYNSLTINRPVSVSICIMSALRVEITPYIKNLKEGRIIKTGSYKIHEGYVNGIKVALLRGGVRKKKAIKAANVLIARYPGAKLIFSGTAGGIDPKLKIGDTVVGTESIYHDGDDNNVIKSDEELINHCKAALKKSTTIQPVYFGLIATGDTFINKNNRISIIERFDPLCVDMETAAVANICKEFNVPFLAVRSISDTTEDGNIIMFYKNAHLASKRSFSIVELLLEVIYFKDK